MKLRTLAVVLLLALVGAPSCRNGGGADDAYRLEIDGSAKVTSGSGDRTVDDGKHSLAPGDRVRMLDGDATLELPGDRSILLRAATGDHEASVMQVDEIPELVDGDAVAVAGSDGMHFSAGDVDVQLAEGAARVQRGLGVTVAIYEGSATVRSAGRALDGGLPALRQVSIATTGQLPRQPVPLLYDAAKPDPWDLRFLGDAIDLGRFLDGQAKGFTGQLGPRVRVDAGLLQRVLPPLADEVWVRSKLEETERSAGEALVGASIVVESSGAVDEGRWDDVFAFREAGARWGLVALDQQVKRDALTDRLRDAFGRSPFLFAAGPPQSTGGSAPSTTTPTARTTTPPTTGGGETTTTQPPSSTIPPPTVPPITVPLLPGQPEDPDEASPPGPTEEVVHTVRDLIDSVSQRPDSVTPGGGPSSP